MADRREYGAGSRIVPVAGRPGQLRQNVRVIGADGVPKRVTVYGSSEAEVRSKRRKLLAGAARGQVQPAGAAVTLEAFYRQWRDSTLVVRIAGGDIVQSYADTMRLVTERWLLPVVGRVRLDKLNADHWDQVGAALLAPHECAPGCRWRRKGSDAPCSRQGRALAAGSRRDYMAILRRLVDEAVLTRKLATNPFRAFGVKLPKVAATTDRQTHSDDDVAAFLAAADRTRYFALFAAYAYSGRRCQEWLDVTWADLDLDAGVVQIATYKRHGRPVGPLELRPELVAVLRAHRADQARERLAAGPRWSPLDLVFPTRFGSRMQAQTVNDAAERIADAAGVSRGVHIFRHTYATNALADPGTSYADVAANLGNTAATVVRHYHHATSAGRGAAAAAVAGSIRLPERNAQ